MFLSEKNLGLSAKFSSENCFSLFKVLWETALPRFKSDAAQNAVSRALPPPRHFPAGFSLSLALGDRAQKTLGLAFRQLSATCTQRRKLQHPI